MAKSVETCRYAVDVRSWPSHRAITRRETPDCGRCIDLPQGDDATSEHRKTMYSSTSTDLSLSPATTSPAGDDHLLTIHSSELYIGVVNRLLAHSYLE